MANELRTRDGLPFNFVDGLRIKGVDVTNWDKVFIDQGASYVGFQPVGNLAASNVQAAIAELESEKQSKTEPITTAINLRPGANQGIVWDNDAFGGTQDTASITLETAAGEATKMRFKMTNDSDDNFEFTAKTADGLTAYNNAMTLNGNVLLNAANYVDYAAPMISDYTALRAYTGSASQVRITTNGLAGFFYYDASDTASTDNGGTVIVSGNGKRWKRLFDGAVNVKWFGATGGGQINDTPSFLAAEDNPAFLPKSEYLVENLQFSNYAPRLFGAGTFKTNVVGVAVVTVASTNRLSGSVFEGLSFTQPNDQTMTTGTKDDHFCLIFNGVDDSRVSNLKFINPDLCIRVGFGSSSLVDRAAYRNIISGVVGYGVRGMGLQLFGSKQGTFTNMSFEGVNFAGETGSKAKFHGLRLTAFDFAPNIGNIIELTVKSFENGVSIQRASYHNTINIYAENCNKAALVHGADEGVTADVSTNNTLNISANNCQYALYDSGGAHNTFNVCADSCAVGGILALPDGGVAGLAKHNKYYGSVKNTIGRLADIRCSYATFDLNLEGVGVTSTYGLLLQGSNCAGQAIVKNCDHGVRITGDNNIVSVDVSGSVTTSASVAGNGNTVTVRADGNISITGNNNTIIGSIGGVVTNSGSGNKYDASGVFTPGLIGTSIPGTYTAGTSDVGTWVREGRLVRFYLVLSGTILDQSGILMITGLPFYQSQQGQYQFRNNTQSINGIVTPRSITPGAAAYQISLSGQTYASGDTIVVSGVYTAY